MIQIIRKGFLEKIRNKFINDRRKYLFEQAEIARSLGISNPTFDSSTFTAETGDRLTTLEKEQPFYFRGYIAIEKEIELLNSRGNNVNVFDKFYKDIKTVGREDCDFKNTKITPSEANWKTARQIPKNLC